ncbi:MAG: MATE family efflux transporter [Bacteroidia bacterium]
MFHIFKKYQPYFGPILRLSYPIIIGQIGIVLMGVADIVMIGRLDATNLAAAGLANSVFFFVTILGIGTLTAISPLVAKSRGGGHTNEVALFFRQGIWASLILSFFICLLLYMFTLNLHWLGQDEEVTELTKPYLHILNAGTVFMLLFMAAKQFSDGLSYTKPAAVITIAGLLLNVLLNWILIFGKLGFPAYGLNGAGYATSITRLLMAVVMIAFVLRNPIYHQFLHVKERIGNLQLLKLIFKVGVPSGFQYFFEVGAFAFAAVMIGWFGKNQLAAHQIAINLASVTYMVATGLSVGGSIVVGDAWGRKNKKDMMFSGRAALIMSVLFMAATAIVFALANRMLVYFYTPDPMVSDLAANLLLIAALFQLSDGVQCVSLGILRGLADTRIPTLITIIAYWVVGIPAGWWMASALGWELYGIWFGLSLGLTFSAIFLSIRFIKESRAFNFPAEEQEKFSQLIDKA